MADEINHTKLAAAHLAAAIIQARGKVTGAKAAAKLYCECYEALIEEGKKRHAPNAVTSKAGGF